MRVLACCALLLLCAGFPAVAQYTAKDFLRFTDSSASSTYSTPDGETLEYDSHRALQPGNSYWSSSGGHGDDEQVTWTGTLPAPVQIDGLKIRWAYAPQEVEIIVSTDGVNSRVAVPWSRTPSDDASFDQNIKFDQALVAKSVTIAMRKAAHNYFGISEVNVVGGGEPLFMLVSGVTAPAGDMCLQVVGGNYNIEGAEVVLDSCAEALAAGDGRELWRTNDNQQIVSARSSPQKCLTLEGGNVDGRIVLSDCLRSLEENDGRSSWNFEANSQLRVLRNGSYCLTQKNAYGTAAGLGNVVASAGATTRSTSTLDTQHGPNNVVDNNPETYWASSLFPDAEEHKVQLDIDLGKPVPISQLRIDWEYPAMTYRVLTSLDGQSFAEKAGNTANPSVSTLENMNGENAQVVRIEMSRPHPRLGKIGAQYVYGIRGVHVMANRLQTSVADCKDAANSDDARDKYFVEYASEFDPQLATSIVGIEEDTLSMIRHLNVKAKELEDSIPKLDSCLREKKSYRAAINSAQRRISILSGQFQEITGLHSHHVVDITPGDSPTHPAEDCFIIKSLDQSASSGFYWILPPCSADPLRVYCDMKTGTAIYVHNGGRAPGAMILEKLNTIDDIRLTCAALGLEPLVLKTRDQLVAAETAMKLIGYPLGGESVVPLAYDYACNQGRCSGKYYDLLDGATDVTGLVMSKMSPSSTIRPTNNAAGFGMEAGATMTFDLGSAKPEAILCSTNTMNGESSLPHLDIGCETTAETDAFIGVNNTNIVVECPPGCDDASVHAKVFGANGIYAASSSICKAAIHHGTIKSGGIVNVSLESGRKSYEGSLQNGVQSASLTEEMLASDATRSIRVGAVQKNCPIEQFESPASSLLQTAMTSFTQLAERTTGTPSMIDPITATVIEKTLRAIDQLHGVDPLVTLEAEENAAVVVAEARKRLKPSERLHREQNAATLELYTTTEDLSSQLHAAESEFSQNLEGMTDRLNTLETAKIEGAGFATLELDSKSMPFSQHFSVSDSRGARHGPSDWGYTSASVGGRQSAVAQTSRIAGLRPGEGSYGILKGHRFFDTTTTVDINAEGSGSVGLAFRTKDAENTYLLEMNQKEGLTRLLRIEEGVATVVAQREDGGYLPGKWFSVQVDTTGGRINVAVGHDGQAPSNILAAVDERYLSGSVGFFVSGLQDGAYFDNLRVQAKKCQKNSAGPVPAPPRCSNFRENYFGKPLSVYNFLDAEGSIGATGNWEYRDNVGGRPKVATQTNAVRGANELGAHAIIKGSKTCKDGHFSFDFFPECTGGIIGGIFRYNGPDDFHTVEATPTELRIRSVQRSNPITIARKSFEIHQNKWHSINLEFDGPAVTARALSPTGHEVSVFTEELLGGNARDGHVGLTSYNCGGVAFDQIKMAPYANDKVTDLIESSLLQQSSHMNRPWSVCTKTVHLLQRRDRCQSMLHDAPAFRQMSCGQDFCAECCSYHTSLLKNYEKEACMKSCRRNDSLAESLQNSFLHKIEQCLDKRGAAYAHCSSDDSACQMEACQMCCKSSEGVEDVEDLPADFIKDAASRELKECNYNCTRRITLLA